MKPKFILRLLFIIFNLMPIYSFCQVDKSIKVSIGVSRRQEVFRLEDKLNYPDPTPGLFDFDDSKHFICTSLAIDISRNIWNKHWFVQLSNSLRYGHVVYIVDKQNKKIDEIKHIKHDHMLDMLYKFNFKKPKAPLFVVGVGLGYLNKGTKFNYDFKTDKQDASGNWIYEQKTGYLGMFQPRLLLGIERRNIKNPTNSLNAYIIVHASEDEDFQSFASVWPELKISYTISPFLKKRK